jgi:hypothetical protein
VRQSQGDFFPDPCGLQLDAQPLEFFRARIGRFVRALARPPRWAWLESVERIL